MAEFTQSSIDWPNGSVVGWSHWCHENCLCSATPTASPSPRNEAGSALDLSSVPSVYHDLAEAFSKDSARSLPPQQPYDCEIELFQRAPLLTSHLNSLSKSERESMECYITVSLALGIIHPVADCLFVEKKDKSLRPCIDYRGLNKITIENEYFLSLSLLLLSCYRGHEFLKTGRQECLLSGLNQTGG